MPELKGSAQPEALATVYGNILPAFPRSIPAFFTIPPLDHARFHDYYVEMANNQRKNLLDDIDIRILSALQKDGKLSYVQLASQAGLSESACLRRVRLLEEQGIIDRYVMLINQAAIGKPGTVFVQVTLDGQQQDKLLRFEKEIGQVPEVMECYLMAGDSDFLLRIIIRDNDDYLRIHNRLTSLTGVLRVQSSFALKTILRKTELPL